MNMMNNLFSMFDPSSSYMSLNWLMVMVILFIIVSNKMMLKNKKNLASKKMKSLIQKEMSQLMGVSKKNMSINTMSNLFMMILVFNYVALLPFNFTLTAHISISFSISMTFWTSLLLFNLSMNFSNLMTHLTPMGTPVQLMNFMVIIETISNIIRPITLAVRLTANMVAGHLLMSLLSSFSMESTINTGLSSMFMMALILLEMMVAMVQAYVLTTLMTLYYSESF